MSAAIHRLSWFPNVPDHFVTLGSEVNLYKVNNYNNQKISNGIELSKKSYAQFLASETRYQYIRCLAPSFQQQVVIALGLANGKVCLSTFDSSGEANIEFTPRQQRSCLCLAWNELETNLLAIGHDRNRSDHCIAVWDTDRGVPKESSNLIGLSETAHSLCWDKNSRILIAGMSQKNIKLFDLRQNNTACTPIITRMVYGLSVSPGGRYLASYVDTMVGVWDLRNIDKPLTQIQTLKNITNLAWCPTRLNILSTIQRDSPYIHLIENYCIDMENFHDMYSTKRLLAPIQGKYNSQGNKNACLVDISWHPNDMERVLLLSESGAIIDFKVPPKISIAWDTNNNLWYSNGLETSALNTSNILPNSTGIPNFCEFSILENFNDIAETMHRRVLNGYGLVPEIGQNGDLAQNLNLKSVWALLGNMTKDEQLLGLKTILGVNNSQDCPLMMRSETQLLTWPDYINNSYTLTTYKSDHRDLAQVSCGWTFNNDMEILVDKFVPELCGKKEFSRAAMICVFHLKIKNAIDILSKAADQVKDSSTLRMAAIALSGFNADRCSSMWRTQRSTAYMQINDPFLRAIFSFLTVENDDFELVMMEKGVPLSDRLAFACKYLSDNTLAEHIKMMIQACIETGDLNGLLLTGESSDGINLLQSNLDWTDDVQTVSLIAIRFFHHEIFSDYRVQYWISSYRNLLDSWGLWEKRAELDIKMENIRTQPKQSRSVFLLCNFCGKSVSAALQEDTRIRNASSNINKLSSCPHCRKPLPRCSLCLLHMGTTTGLLLQSTNDHDNLGWQSKPFSKWFSWCQTCRHGGHTEHLIQWFKQNAECPVTGCSCKCFALDLPVPPFLRDTI